MFRKNKFIFYLLFINILIIFWYSILYKKGYSFFLVKKVTSNHFIDPEHFPGNCAEIRIIFLTRNILTWNFSIINNNKRTVSRNVQSF